MVNYRKKVSDLINFINENGYNFRENNNIYYNEQSFEVFHNKFETFSIKAVQSNKTLRLIFSDKDSKELFGIKQIGSNFEIISNNAIMDYPSQNNLLEDINTTIDELEFWFIQEIKNKKSQKEKEQKLKLDNVCEYFNVELSNPSKVFQNKNQPEDLFLGLIKYLFKDSPSYLYEKNKNKDLVYLLKTSYGEIEVNFGYTQFHNSEKTLHINFLNEKKETVFSIRGFKDKFINETLFDMRLISKNYILNSSECNLLLNSIPSESFIKEFFEIINNDISNFKQKTINSDNEILGYVNQLKKPTENTILQFRDNLSEGTHKKNQY